MNKFKRGFTMIEMLIYMGLLSMFLVVLSGMFVSILQVQLDSETTAGLQQDGQYFLSRLAYDLERPSNTVTTPAAAGQNSPSLVSNLFTYGQNGSNFQITDSVGTDNLNSNETQVSNLKFLRLGNGAKDTIQVSFTLKSVAKRQSGQESRNFITTVGLR